MKAARKNNWLRKETKQKQNKMNKEYNQQEML